MDSSNAPFCNLYNRKCDFSPSRAAWHPDFFVMGLCSPFALRYAGQLQAGAQDSRCLLPRAARQSAGAMLAVLRACWPAARSAGVRCVWPQIWCVRAAARVAAQLRPRSATATVRRRIWLVPWAKLSMRTISMDLTGHWRPGMAQRTRRVDGIAQCLPHQQSLSGRLASCLRLGRKAASRCGLPPPSSTVRTMAFQIYNNVCAGTCSCKIARLIFLPGMP